MCRREKECVQPDAGLADFLQFLIRTALLATTVVHTPSPHHPLNHVQIVRTFRFQLVSDHVSAQMPQIQTKKINSFTVLFRTR